MESKGGAQAPQGAPAVDTGNGPKRFRASERALEQRRWLVLGVKALALASLVVVLIIFQPPLWWVNLAKWALAAALAGGVWRAQGALLLDPLRQRELLLHEHALELKRGDFRRFVVFESLRHIVAIQGPDERLFALVLHTSDDSILLRDIEGLPQVFTALSVLKPKGVFIEVESRRLDWGEPLPWAASFAVAALLLAWLLWVAPWQTRSYLSGNGRLMVLNGAMLTLWRPSSRGERWTKQVPEGLVGALLVFFGQVFLH